MNRNEFIAYLAPYAVKLRAEGSPLFPSVRLAQNLLETGGVVHAWNNLGGIKVGSGVPNQWWDGSSISRATWEVINGQRVNTSENFRVYKSIYHFYKDQDLLFQLPRYEGVRSAKTPEEQASKLQLSGYATDPNYAGKILTLINELGLRRYDEEDDELNLSENERKMLVNALKRLVDQKVISDEKWIEKAENGTLTISELTWLNTIILTRL